VNLLLRYSSQKSSSGDSSGFSPNATSSTFPGVVEVGADAAVVDELLNRGAGASTSYSSPTNETVPARTELGLIASEDEHKIGKICSTMGSVLAVINSVCQNKEL